MSAAPFLLRLFSLALASAAASAQPIDLGARRELLVDDYLIAHRHGLELRLHRPIPRETVMTYDAPWEGSGSDFERIIRLGDIIRLYYLAGQLTTDDGTKLPEADYSACILESVDGIHWVRPDLGLIAYHGSKHNNITWRPPKLDAFTPFRDANPDSPPDEKFKATGLFGDKTGLYGLNSPDGIHWSLVSDRPIMTGFAFDTQNNAFWDPVRRKYWCYIRGHHDKNGSDVIHGANGIRDIRVATSPDFRNWTHPKLLRYGDSPDEALYTNQIEPYYRAPELFVGFPARYCDRRADFPPAAMAALPDPTHRQRRMKFNIRYGAVVTDGQFMTSRDGYAFHRWDETFIPPGPERSDNWVYGDGYQSLGLLQTPAEDPTAPPELSCYVDEGHWKEGETVRRYTMRIDGFVSLHARLQPGEFTTKALIFAGRRLSLNFASSAAGSIKVEIESSKDAPLPGYALSDCDDLFGDTLDRTVTWRGRSDVSALAGRPIHLRFVMSQADLYSLKFEDVR